MPYLNRRWITFFASSIAFMVTVIAIVGWVNFKEGVANKDAGQAYGVDPNFGTNWTDASQVLVLSITIDSFDPVKSATPALGFRIKYLPLYDLLDNQTILAPQVPVRLLLDTATINFAADVAMPLQSVSQVLDGDINRYPFDVYTAAFDIAAYTSPSNTSYGTPLPITAFTQGTVQGFHVETQFQGLADDGSIVELTFTIRRSPISKLFAIIIFLVMWGLSGSIFVAAMSVWFREKKAELPLIAISTALLFALPNIRNSQPGIPTIAGTTSDMSGFFWNILLVAVSAISLLINYILKNAREKPKAPASSPDVERGQEIGETAPLQMYERRK